jgi:asparagine synthase (glutamine-hydrolysing)
MCGIAAAINWDGAEAAVERLIAGLSHRGEATDPLISPWPGVAVCTRRLKIVDPAGGVQPQVSADGRILVSFNGEIFNHAALRRELEAMGVRFVTASDTEVLANALAAWGGGALQRLRGMFAFVAIDLKSREFIAARDAFGEKPLYVIQSGAGFLFCSEIRPLLQATQTGDVMLLPPGYVLGRGLCRPFASLPAPAVRGPGRPAALDAALSAAVEACVPPDLPFALMFSGGIDSTLVAHYARRIRPEAPGYFLGDEAAPDYPFAACYAEKTGLDLRVLPFDGAAPETFAAVGRVVEAIESFEPSVVRPSICSYALAEAIHKDGFRVALVGEGADELFAGYQPVELSYAAGEAFGDSARDQCLAMLNRSALQRTDRCAMRFGIEARSPFLDRDVVEHAFGLAGSALVTQAAGAPRGKAPLRALYDLYPEALPAMIRDRRKIPVNEGAGLDISQTDSALKTAIEETVSDADFADGRRLYRDFDLGSKEELYYLRILAASMDVWRVPHLKGRLKLEVAAAPALEPLRAYSA